MKTFYSTAVLAVTLAGMGCLAQAQDPPQSPAAPPAAAPAPAPSMWTIGGVDFSGMLDGYYSFNFNHPSSETNGLRNFDVQSNNIALNMAKLTMSHDPNPVGFRVDLGFGKAFDIVNGADTAPKVFRNIEQLYVSLKPKNFKGIEVDVGKFVTSAGAEVIETKDNWNYSRSLLFAWAIPYYHLGARITAPLGSHFTAGVQIVNGWNNADDNNGGKTLGFSGAYTAKKFTWTNVVYTGPENSGTNKGRRNLYDSTLLLTPSDKANFYINYDYGRNGFPQGGGAVWTGIAGAAHFQLNSWFALAPRTEWFADRNGFSTGTAQHIKEFTMTAEAKMSKGLLARLEYRGDWSDQPFFDRGGLPGSSKQQNTVALGVVAFFGPSR